MIRASPSPPLSRRPRPMTQPWWQHESHTVLDDDILFDGHSLTQLARQHGTPLYVYSRETVQRQLRRMQDALAAVRMPHRIYYAMKSNRHPGVLRAVRDLGDVGIDTCSPREVELALVAGFAPGEISFNAGMLSTAELAYLASSGVHCTLDTLSGLRRYAALAPAGTAVGLRFNPGVRVGYGDNPKMAYGDSKFGFEPDGLEQILETVRALGLRVDAVHMHIGWGLTQNSVPQVAKAFTRLADIGRHIEGLEYINVGGGLGARYVEGDQPLELSSWASLIAEILGPLGATICCEPGTFVSASSGMLVVEANTIETRRGVTWLGVNAGFAINPNPSMYGIALTALALQQPRAEATHAYTIAGNINESGDIWGRDMMLPVIQEGELLAFFPAGAYGSSMGSDHCLRGKATEVMLETIAAPMSATQDGPSAPARGQ
ncbi:MAG TPA: diaminopimelate decarboxylase [Arenimonas sp.]|nr:diaminopimelate decarboxylase [Arenimonas sp.]